MRIAFPTLQENAGLARDPCGSVCGAFPDIQHEAKDLLFDGDRVTMRFDGEGTHKEEFAGIKATNKTMRYEGIAIFRMEGSRIAEIWVHSSAAKQIAALQD